VDCPVLLYRVSRSRLPRATSLPCLYRPLARYSSEPGPSLSIVPLAYLIGWYMVRIYDSKRNSLETLETTTSLTGLSDSAVWIDLDQPDDAEEATWDAVPSEQVGAHSAQAGQETRPYAPYCSCYGTPHFSPILDRGAARL
jgi:hypothetical protein